MFKDYNHVLEMLNIKCADNGIHKIDDDHDLIMMPIIKKPHILIRIKKNEHFLKWFNRHDCLLVEYPEQLYHILSQIIERN